MTDLKLIDLRKLDSLTKYPSIPTYHALDPNGRGGLTEEPLSFRGTVIGTEKVDGANARLIILPGHTWLIGSRDELLTASEDIIYNPKHGIVDALRGLAESIDLGGGEFRFADHVVTLYLEVYGDRSTNAWKQYGDGKTARFRLFDVSVAQLDILRTWEIERIVRWRDDGYQHFLHEGDLQDLAVRVNAPLTPRLFTIPAEELPTGIDEMWEFLQQYKRTQVAVGGGAFGGTEGIVFRTPDRSTIAKARFQNYRRTFDLRHGTAR